MEMIERISVFPCRAVAALMIQIALSQGQWNIESYNFADLSVTCNIDDVINRCVVDHTGRRFKIHEPGLTGQANTVSFESLDFPQRFLTHLDNDFVVLKRFGIGSSNQSRNDSTFYKHLNKFKEGYYAFESVNHRDYYLRHKGYELYISPLSEGEPIEEDASWRLVFRNIMLQPKYQETCTSFHCKVGCTEHNQAVYGITGMQFHIVSPGLSGQLNSVSLQQANKLDAYLREFDEYVFIDSISSPRPPYSWEEDCTFYAEYNVFHSNWLSIQSSQRPGRYLILLNNNKMSFSQDDSTSTYGDRASYGLRLGPVYILNKNDDGLILGVNEDNVAEMNPEGYKFNMQLPGLNLEKGTTTFESYSNPGAYLTQCHDDQLCLESDADVADSDTTFSLRMDLWYTSFTVFQSLIHPDRYIRRKGTRVLVHDYLPDEQYHTDISFTAVDALADDSGPEVTDPTAEKLSVGAIIGIVLATLGFITLCAFVYIWKFRKPDSESPQIAKRFSDGISVISKRGNEYSYA